MTYRTAASAPHPANERLWTDAVYRRHGVTDRATAQRWRALGVPATVAAALTRAEITHADATWLAQTFSVLALRSLCAPRRHLAARDIVGLRTMAAEDTDRCRRWVKRTSFTVAEVVNLDRLGIPPLRAQQWHDRLPLLQRGTVLSEILTAAAVVHHVPTEHLAGWVRHTVVHDVAYREPIDGTWRFLGGHTAVMAAAGLSPREANALVAAGSVDVDRLRTLAGLRALGR